MPVHCQLSGVRLQLAPRITLQWSDRAESKLASNQPQAALTDCINKQGASCKSTPSVGKGAAHVNESALPRPEDSQQLRNRLHAAVKAGKENRLEQAELFSNLERG